MKDLGPTTLNRNRTLEMTCSCGLHSCVLLSHSTQVIYKYVSVNAVFDCDMCTIITQPVYGADIAFSFKDISCHVFILYTTTWQHNSQVLSVTVSFCVFSRVHCQVVMTSPTCREYYPVCKSLKELALIIFHQFCKVGMIHANEELNVSEAKF